MTLVTLTRFVKGQKPWIMTERSTAVAIANHSCFRDGKAIKQGVIFKDYCPQHSGNGKKNKTAGLPSLHVSCSPALPDSFKALDALALPLPAHLPLLLPTTG